MTAYEPNSLPSLQRKTDRPPFALELCAGSAKLSYVLRQEGVETLSIDYDKNRHSAWGPVVQLDLASSQQCLLLLDLIETKVVDLLFLAPPCGTCSRAREIKLPGRNCPQPLRSEQEPWGLGHLSDGDKARVDKANQIYRNLIVLASAQTNCGGLVAIENPSRSIFWFLPQIEQLLSDGYYDTEFQHCKWSVDEAGRPKWTRIRSNVPGMNKLSGRCHLGHTHLPWGIKSDNKFATADEAEYPLEMCRSLTTVFVEHLHNIGFSFAPKLNQDLSSAPAHKRRRTAANRQPRGRKLPPVVSEFQHILTISPDTPKSEWHKLLRYEHWGEEGNSAEPQPFPVVGIWRSPTEFIEAACQAQHPVDSQASVPDVVKQAIVDHFQHEPSHIVQSQVSFLRFLAKLINDQETEENRVHASLDKYSCRVTTGKKFLALQALLDKHSQSWTDSKLVTDITSGFRLTGMQSHTGVFDFEPVLPTNTVEQLRANSTFQNKTMMSKTKTSGDTQIDTDLWTKAMDEVEKGWLIGPFTTLENLMTVTGISQPHVSRRFAILQSGKLRPIDDFKESDLNTTFGRCDRLSLMDIDSIVAIIRLVEQIATNEVDKVEFSDGSTVSVGPLADSLSTKWLGATFDLHAAYKQLHVHPDDRWASVVALHNPNTSSPNLFLQVVLPFGASASVTAFNRLARFLWYLGTVELKAVWANFFDDYPLISTSTLAPTTKKSIELMFKLLGWELASGDKAASFSELFTALGVQFSLTDLASRKSFVQNTLKRVEHVKGTIADILTKGRMSQQEVESLKGRLQFMESGFFGRTGKSVIMSLTANKHKTTGLSFEDREALQAVVHWLNFNQPRLVSPMSGSRGLILFTDGACEDGQQAIPLTTCGALLIDLDSGQRYTFGTEIDPRLLESWMKTEAKRQLVTEAEIFAVLLSFQLWSQLIMNRKILIFVDSEPTMFSYIRGTSNSNICRALVREFFVLQSKCHCFQWFTRVPTKSNPADLPSRLRVEEAAALYNATVVSRPPPVSITDWAS